MTIKTTSENEPSLKDAFDTLDYLNGVSSDATVGEKLLHLRNFHHNPYRGYFVEVMRYSAAKLWKQIKEFVPDPAPESVPSELLFSAVLHFIANKESLFSKELNAEVDTAWVLSRFAAFMPENEKASLLKAAVTPLLSAQQSPRAPCQG